jgi:hypothetical protein
VGFIADVVANNPILASWGNTIRNRVMMDFTNAAERASQWVAPPEGAHAYLRDVDRAEVFDGTAWAPIGSRVLASVQGTANVNGASPATAPIIATPSLVIPANRRIKCSYTSMWVNTGGAGIINAQQLARSGTVIQSFQHYISPGGAGNNELKSWEFVDTPPAGSHVYQVQWFSGLASNVIDSATANYIRQFIVEDIGSSL